MKARTSHHVEIDARLISGVLCLGLMLAWMLSGWNYGNTIFGVQTTDNSFYPIFVQISTGLLFLFFTFIRRPFVHISPKVQILLSSLLAVVSVMIYWCGLYFESKMLVIISSLTTGFVLALFLRAWISFYLFDFDQLLIVALLASGINHLLNPSVYTIFWGDFSGKPSRLPSPPLLP